MTDPTSQAEPLVSIVLSTNRNSPFLDATLKSVSDQTWQHWELIIVDNGGPDPSRLDELARTMPNCIVVHRPPGGVSMGRNAGVIASRGELLVFLDDDDVWHPDRLRRQVAELSINPDAVACYSSARHIDAYGAELPVGWPPTGATREQLLSGAIDMPRIVTLMVRRDPFITLGCFNTAFELAEDHEWILRLLCYGRFVCLPDALVGYRRHSNNVSNAGLTDRIRWTRRAIVLQQWAAEADANQDHRRLMAQYMLAFRRRNAELWVGSGVGSAKSGHVLRASGDFARACRWSAPRAACVAAIKLARFARKPWAKGARQPIRKNAAAHYPAGYTTFGRPDGQRLDPIPRIGGQDMSHSTDMKHSQGADSLLDAWDEKGIGLR